VIVTPLGRIVGQPGFYLLRSVAECAGAPEETADKLEKTVHALNCARTYEEYLVQSREEVCHE